MTRVWRRASGLLALAGLVGLLLTWPGGHEAAAIGVALVVGTIVLLVLRRRRLALVPLGALGLTTMLLQGSLTTWHAWVAPVLFVVVLDALLLAGRDPPDAWHRTGALATGLVVAGVLGWNWRPIRASLVGEEGILVAIGLMAAVAMGIVLWSTSEEEETLVGGN